MRDFMSSRARETRINVSSPNQHSTELPIFSLSEWSFGRLEFA